ncbi:MAG TPA: glycosyltransferase family 1 protein [Chloroflexi bacterium]|nr:glycosyltransferase family 1 protein [Chloroflexota bacterium]
MKILFFANTSWNLYNFRLPLMKALGDLGHTLVAVAPKDRFTDHIQAQGFHWRNLLLQQHGLNPLVDVWTLWQIWRIYRAEKPDIVSHFTVKCVLYGSIAAHVCGVKHIVNTITGLGLLFTHPHLHYRMLRGVVMLAYKRVLRNTTVIFQNVEDRELFISRGIVKAAQTHLVRGSGVEMPETTAPPAENAKVRVILPGRLVWTKGVRVFAEAARLLKAKQVPVEMVLVGQIPHNDRTAIAEAQVKQWEQDGVLAWWGWRDDMDQVYAQADIVCMPSLYGEGVPRTLIEAAAHGRAVIAADNRGCRDIVRDGVNGCLVPQDDAEALANAIRQLAADPSLRRQMGAAGREMVRRSFSADNIIAQSMAVYLAPFGGQEGIEPAPGDQNLR